jgi:thiol-disulfide isomerase/thioredoxin
MKPIVLLCASMLLAVLLGSCTARPGAQATGSQPRTEPTPAVSSGGSAINDMLLKAGFAVPNSDVEATDFSLPALDGIKQSLASYRGRFVFLSFWATWCGPCKQEIPSLQALYEKLKQKGFVVVAVDLAEEPSTVRAFVKAHAMTFPVVLDSDGAIGGAYGAQSIPTNFLVDRKGKVLARIVGFDGIEWDSPERIALFEKLLAL